MLPRMPTAPCSLYLQTPRTITPDFTPTLAAALDAAPIAALLLLDKTNYAASHARSLTEPRGVALILADDAPLAVRLGCDGAHITDADATRAARAALGEDLQLGVFCGASRDAAMRAGEHGADYVTFGPFHGGADDADPALIGWWAEMMELPVVAACRADVDRCAAIARAGADFVLIGDDLWEGAASPASTVRALHAALQST